MKKTIIMVAVLLVSCCSVFAQDEGRKSPVRFGAAVTAGANSYATVSSLPSSLASYDAEALSVDWTDKGTAFGVEGSLLFKGWKFDLGGTFSFGYNPGYTAVPGTMDSSASAEDNLGEIPSYEAVAERQKVSYRIYVGASYYLPFKAVPALKPYVGGRVAFGYANDIANKDDYTSMGRSVAETMSLGVAAVAGIDYFVAKDFFVGVAVNALDYTYGYTAYRPQEGLANLGADTHHIGFLAHPLLKVGFLF